MDNLTITHHSGTLRNVEISGTQYSVSHLYCACDNVTITPEPHEHDAPGVVSVKIHCPAHGELRAVAIACGLPFRCEVVDTVKTKAIFAWVNERHDKDRRIAWGMKRRTA